MELSHVGIWVRDMQETDDFLRSILGLREGSSYQVGEDLMKAIFGTKTACEVRAYELEDGRVEVFQAPKGILPGINHFAISVLNKGKFCEQAAKKGARIVKVWRKDHPVYFLKDPSDILIEVRE